MIYKNDLEWDFINLVITEKFFFQLWHHNPRSSPENDFKAIDRGLNPILEDEQLLTPESLGE